MIKKCFITGHTSGLGKDLYNYFVNIGWDVQGFSTSNGWDIEKDYEKIVSVVTGADLFINNAYANGTQKKLVEMLFGKVKGIIVCGSVAGDGDGDLTRPEYSKHKKELEEFCDSLAKVKQSTSDLLLIKLTSSSYSDSKAVINLVDFWLDNPSIISVKFNVINYK